MSKKKFVYICHHGVQGQKWYVRRYQPYSDGDKAASKGKEVGEAKKTKTKRTKNKIIKTLKIDKIKKRLKELASEPVSSSNKKWMYATNRSMSSLDNFMRNQNIAMSHAQTANSIAMHNSMYHSFMI